MPQLKDGYVQIATEILEALVRYRIPGEQVQCLLFIIRKTYGFHKKWDMISNSQFVKATGMNKSNVCRAINGLIGKNIVVKKDNKQIPSYRFNKYYKTWKVLSKKITVKSVVKKDNQVLSKKRPTKDTTTIDIFNENSVELKLSSLLLNLILKNNPKFKKPNLQKWCTHIARAIRIDKRTPDELRKVIIWCQQDDFWKANILSTSKLRKQFDKLWIKMPKHEPSRQKKPLTDEEEQVELDRDK